MLPCSRVRPQKVLFLQSTLVNAVQNAIASLNLTKSPKSAKSTLLFMAMTGLTPFGAYADNIADSSADIISDKAPAIEVITISHQRFSQSAKQAQIALAQGSTSAPDLANWLHSVPGANVNRNGPVTGIAQYRGLFGDRVATTIDGHSIIGAGPNAMDTPLSYSTPLIVDSLEVYRGIAPVSAAIDTLGGAINVNMRKAQAYQQAKTQLNGDAQLGWRSNNDAKTGAGVVNISRGDIGALLFANVQEANDMETGDGRRIRPTQFQKRQFGGDVRVDNGDSDIGLSYHYLDTQDSGTPALPMDIEYIFSHRVGLDGHFKLADWQLNWQLGYLDADHKMTNFALRTNNNPMRHRRNHAEAETIDIKVSAEQTFDFGSLTLGIDGYFAEHDSVITNPNNQLFFVNNFNAVEDHRYGVFAELATTIADSALNFGIRVKQAQSDAGDVATSMAMLPMPAMLQNRFNNADRNVTETDVDVAINSETRLNNQVSITAGIGMKTRAPSYQERYLWLPMEATAGLADGRTYIGNIHLNSERAYQFNFGINLDNEQLTLSPQFFYQQIDDYIQGTPLAMDEMAARMVAQVMAGDENPLQFNNVDAKLYGLDVNWQYRIDQHWQLSGVASYVRGERRDIDDQLYRIAPLNTQVNIAYQGSDYTAMLKLAAFAKQNKVSTTNLEQTSAGYGLVNLDLHYYLSPQITLKAGVDNLLDKDYRSHLSGYNRVNGGEIAQGTRIPGEGISAWFEASYSF
ncbi:TonB-dependent receptor [Endozoicomonas sp. G2_1]|uniref:TonB-dependent receptor n=1 Tax=Endozoicomonas sp. G2_1 TaxID=2821091 RepID=UPI001ADAC576|nr:TonB-dependent receptor [Endozoicomonas sp. G2_1]MBO9490665.1 TonB-dependent receptor [Endozoicomonas sp. G2_1]